MSSAGIMNMDGKFALVIGIFSKFILVMSVKSSVDYIHGCLQVDIIEM